MATTFSRVELDKLLLARVREALAGVTIHYAEVPTTPPPLSPSDPRVKPYVVYWPDLGHPGFETGNTELAGGGLDLVYQPQWTCVGGYPDAAMRLVDRLHAALNGWMPPVPPEWSAGPMRPPPGFTTRLIREDDVTPPRFTAFPQFTTRIAT